MELFEVLLDPRVLAFVALGTLLGVYVGAIPGLSGTMAVSLLVSLTYTWSETSAISLMMGVFVGAVFGGSRPAILLNIPGAPAAVATGFDGYPLAKKGRAAEAMGVSTVQSFLGTLIGIAALAFLAPQIAKLSLYFKSADYLLLGLMALLLVGSVSRGSMLKGVIGALFGLLLGMVGNTSQFSVNRFTGGLAYLNGGVSFIVAMIGLLGASEALYQIGTTTPPIPQNTPKRILPKLRVVLHHLPLTLQSALIGVFVGALPGAGGDVAALLSYDVAKRTVRKNEVPFGEGAIEGVIAPETANNAAIGGALIPMLTLGIPGDAVTAVLLGALCMRGWRPMTLMRDDPHLFYLILGCLLFASVCLLVFGLTGIRLFVKILKVPKGILMPVILVLCMVGAYAINTNVYDIILMLQFGVVGFLCKRFRYPVAPVVLGVILRELLESNAIRVALAKGSACSILTPFLATAFLALLVLGVLQGRRRRI